MTPLKKKRMIQTTEKSRTNQIQAIPLHRDGKAKLYLIGLHIITNTSVETFSLVVTK